MENKKIITHEEWEKNYNECLNSHIKNPQFFIKRSTKGGFAGTYLTWSIVWSWMKKNYPDFNFFVKEIDKTSHIVGELWINGNLVGNTALNLEQYQNHAETPEQLINRVFVKLVAQYTGYGFHLWLLGKDLDKIINSRR